VKFELIPFIKNKFINLPRGQHQFLCLEQAIIAEWQSARQDKKFVAKPTQSKQEFIFGK
jgi:hypothetical protein